MTNLCRSILCCMEVDAKNQLVHEYPRVVFSLRICRLPTFCWLQNKTSQKLDKNYNVSLMAHWAFKFLQKSVGTPKFYLQKFSKPIIKIFSFHTSVSL